MEALKQDYEIAAEELEKQARTALLARFNAIPTVRLVGPYEHEGWQALEFALELGTLTLPYRLGLGHVDLQKAKEFIGSKSLNDAENMLLAAWVAKPYANFTNRALQLSLAVKLFRLDCGQAPTAGQILGAWCRDGLDTEQPFEDWAESLSYDTDSRKAEKAYNETAQAWRKLTKLFGRETCMALAELSNRL